MVRTSVTFLRPYLSQATRTIKPEHARAYLSLQRRSTQTLADAHTGPHDVEKQKRLEQLRNVKPLGDYHPRLVHPTGAENLALRDFNAKYGRIKATTHDVVSVFGMSSRIG